MDKNENDLEILTRIIKEQNARGAVIPENPDNRRFQWNEEGRLVSLDLSYCYLSGSLSLDGLEALESAWLNNNKLENLDIDACPHLKDLSCDWNQIRALNVSGCPVLGYLDCSWNKLENLDITGNSMLNMLDVRNNPLKELDTSANPELEYLYCDFSKEETVEEMEDLS